MRKAGLFHLISCTLCDPGQEQTYKVIILFLSFCHFHFTFYTCNPIPSCITKLAITTPLRRHLYMANEDVPTEIEFPEITLAFNFFIKSKLFQSENLYIKITTSPMHYFIGASFRVDTVTGPLLVPKTLLFHVALRLASVLKPANILARASLFLVFRTGSGVSS